MHRTREAYLPSTCSYESQNCHPAARPASSAFSPARHLAETELSHIWQRHQQRFSLACLPLGICPWTTSRVEAQGPGGFISFLPGGWGVRGAALAPRAPARAESSPRTRRGGTGLASVLGARLRPERGKGGKDRVLLTISGFRLLRVSPWTFAGGSSLRVFQPKGSHFFLNKACLICLTRIPQMIADLDST